MVITIIFLVIFAVIFFTKKWWATSLVSLIKKRKNGDKNALGLLIESGAVFRPSGTVRTFNFSLDIAENGDGTVKIAINKLKE